MARTTRAEINIDALCQSYGLKPIGVYHVTKYLCDRARKEHSALVMPAIEMTDEEIILDKQNVRYELLGLMFSDDPKTINQQMVFVHKVIRAPWLWDKLQQLLDQVAMYDDEDLGNLYRAILVKEYFTDFPETNWQLADITNVSECVIEYRKREAIKLFGILIWKYCKEREREDINKGAIIR